METTCSSEAPDDFQRTTWRYNPEDKTLWLKRMFIRKISDGIHNMGVIE
jgi:hypothetical protein